MLKNIFLITLFISWHLYASIRPQELTQTKFNPHDLFVGQQLATLIRFPQKKTSVRTFQHLINHAQSSSIFKIQVPIFQRLLKIKKDYNPIEIVQECQNWKKSDNFLIHKLITWCNTEAINKLIGLKPAQLAPIALQFFQQSPPTYLLKKLFSRSQKKKFHHQVLSKIFITHQASQQQAIGNDLLKMLYIDPTLQDFIQVEAIKEKNRIMSQELTSLYTDYKKIRRENDFWALKELTQRAIALYNEQYDFVRNSPKTFRLIGEALAKLNYNKEAQQYFATLYSISYTYSGKNNPFLFPFLWSYIQNEQYQEASKQIYKFSLLDNLSEYSTKIKFWIAYVFEQTNDKKLAHYIYSNIIINNPLDYYATLADNQMHYHQNSFAKQIANSYLNRQPSSNLKLSTQLTTIVKTINLWNFIGLHRLAQQYVNQLLANKTYPLNEKHLALEKVLTFLKQQQLYLPLFKTIFKNLHQIKLNNIKNLVRYLFPFAYYNKIATLSKKVNPIVILALIRQESGFNPKARSLPGARGLMQIMPSTAKDLQIKGVYELFDPQKNLKAGIMYFEKLLTTFDNNLVYALAAYNAGPNRVKQWIKTTFKSTNPLLEIENIPFKETKQYVKLIYRNIFFYNLLHKL